MCRRRPGRTGTPGRRYWSEWSTPVTDQFGDHLDHQVHDRDATRMAVTGAVPTLCGRWVVPAPMSAPTGRLCPTCAAAINYRHLS